MTTALLDAGSGGPEYTLLDDPDLWPTFGRVLAPTAARPTTCWESHLVFRGMHCAACALTLEQALQSVPGVLEAHVGAASQRGRVVWSPERTRPSVWMSAVRSAGYEAVPAQDAGARDRQQLDSRAMLWRWLVAAFCMMQVMMYATPAYLAQPGDLDANSAQLLRWASWVLTLPVMFFSAVPLMRNALRDLLRRRMAMDLPVALGIVLTFVVSSLGTFEPDGRFGREVYFDSLTMFVFFLLSGRWLEARLRERTLGAIDALANRMPASVLRLVDGGSFERVAAHRLRLADELQVLPGEAFPADGVITVGSTEVDEALLSGESRPLPRSAGGQVIAGSHNLGAPVRMRVTRLGQDTRFAEIVALMANAASSRPRAAALVDRLATPFLLAVLLSALLSAVYWWPQDPGHAMAVAAAVLVVTCPCALSLATPATLLAAAGALARRGVLVRRLDALEALSRVDTVVLDKTGTLTSGVLGVAAVQTRPGLSTPQALSVAAALARHSLHPLSRALVATQPAQSSGWPARDVKEVPGQGVSGWVAKAGCTDGAGAAGEADWQFLRLGAASFCDTPPATGDNPVVHLSDASGWLASFEMREQVRPDAAHTVRRLSDAGLAVIMLSGDQPAAVQRVAAECGIDDARGGHAPQDKLACIKALQAQGHRVAMVGDGLNDGPVLARAEASFAMAQAVPLSRAQADFVVLGEQLGEVADTLLRARHAMHVVRQNLGWAALYNAACVPLAVAGLLPAWLAGLGMALSSLLVVANAGRLARVGSRPPSPPTGQEH